MSDPKPPTRRQHRVKGCTTCEQYGLHGPSHDASDRCESGKRPHCSCDTCF